MSIDIKNTCCIDLFSDLCDDSIDLLVTDPPYRITAGGRSGLNQGKFGMVDDSLSQSGKLFKHNDIAFSDWVDEAYRVLVPGAHAYIMVNDRNITQLINDAEAIGFKLLNILVWDKANAVMNRYYMKSVEFIVMLCKGEARTINDAGTTNLISIRNEVGNKYHPTQKPQALFEVFIRNSSKAGDLVLDPFVGSGAAALAAKALNRGFIGSEIDRAYYDVTVKRLESCQMALI